MSNTQRLASGSESGAAAPEPLVTIFTPCFNRRELLSRLYESLLGQTNRGFVWSIVDDGSTDHTDELVAEWIDAGELDIRYQWVPNGGKQRAHNIAVSAVGTPLFICVDSDDYLLEDAVALLLDHWSSVQDDTRVAGIVALRGRAIDVPLGTWMPRLVEKTTLSDLYWRHGFKGDTALLYRSSVLKQFPFEVPANENFIGESSVYNRIDRRYALSVLNRVVYIGEYLGDGYTAKAKTLILDNPIGYAQLNRDAFLVASTLRGKYVTSVKYLVGIFLSGKRGGLVTAPSTSWAIVAWPTARLLAWRRSR